jgi:uroporphyrinogen decarboxylase
METQYALPLGSVSEVKDEVKRRIDDFAPGGGFLFTPVHTIQPDVPAENLRAMWETFQEYCQY